MALPRKRRLLLLCASFLLCDQLSFPTNPAASKSWFDQHLAKKTQALYEHIRSSNEPDALISVALLDEVCDLRDKVSDPYAIDSTLARIANDPAAPAAVTNPAVPAPITTNDPAAPTAVREEATYLGARVRGAPVETPQSVNALIVRTASEKPSELELQNAISVITSVHGLEMHAVAEHTAEGNNSPEAWYRESKNATDEYRRLQTLRKTLQLNRDYLPAVIDMAKRYSAQGQITRARNMLSATLERYPAEPSLRVLLAELDINQGHASAALEIMSQLRSRILPVAVTRQLADDYAQLRFVHEAQELAHTALQLHPSGIEERELALRLDLQAGDATLNSKQTGVRSPEEARSESSAITISYVSADVNLLRRRMRQPCDVR